MLVAALRAMVVLLVLFPWNRSATKRPRWVRASGGRSRSIPVARPSRAMSEPSTSPAVRHETRRPQRATSTSPNTGTSVMMPPTSSPSDGAPSAMTTMASMAVTSNSASRRRGAYSTWMQAAMTALAASAAKPVLPMPKKRAAVCSEYPSRLEYWRRAPVKRSRTMSPTVAHVIHASGLNAWRRARTATAVMTASTASRTGTPPAAFSAATLGMARKTNVASGKAAM